MASIDKGGHAMRPRPTILSDRRGWLAALLLALGAGGTALVGGWGGGAPSATTGAGTGPASEGPLQNPFEAAVQRLVDGGTITPAEAAVVGAQIEHGSVDPKVLVDSGALSDPQMRAVATSLGAVKRAQVEGR
jgi:hypothetical protein